MSPKRWIFTKSTENRPDGVLQVGQILSDPFEPGTALHPGGPLPLIPVPKVQPSSSTEGSLPPPTKPKTHLYYDMLAPEETSLSGVQLSQGSELTSQFGLWAKLSAPASAAGPGAAVSGLVSTQSSRSETGVWEIAKIGSTIITPSIMYVQDSLRHGDVPSSVSLRWWNRLKGKRLFMVTGVRIVEGARLVKSERKQQRGWGVQGEGQAQVAPGGEGSAGPGVQAGIGGNLSSDQSTSEEMSFESATDFVFAYRLQEIFWYGTGGKVKHGPYKKGETASVGTGETIQIEKKGGKTTTEEEVEFEDFEITDVDEKDFGEAAALQPWPGVVEELVPGVDEVFCLAVRGLLRRRRDGQENLYLTLFTPFKGSEGVCERVNTPC